ncbi:MAG: hypothetical protein ACYCVZ_14910 [Streptosporangiaceae bacterium]
MVEPRNTARAHRAARRRPALPLSLAYWVRPARLGWRSPVFAVALVLRLAAVVLLSWIGDLHWRLWQIGYGDLPTLGPLFLADAVIAVVLAVILLVWPRPLAGLAGACFTAVTIGALVVSLEFGLFGFREVITTSQVEPALVAEPVALVILAAWTLLVARAARDAARRGTGR